MLHARRCDLIKFVVVFRLAFVQLGKIHIGKHIKRPVFIHAGKIADGENILVIPRKNLLADGDSFVRVSRHKRRHGAFQLRGVIFFRTVGNFGVDFPRLRIFALIHMRFRAAHNVFIVRFFGRVDQFRLGHRARQGIENIVLEKNASVFGNEKLLIEIIGCRRKVTEIVKASSETVIDVFQIVLRRAVERAEPIADGIFVKPHFVIDFRYIEIYRQYVFRAFLCFQKQGKRAFDIVLVQPLVRKFFIRFRAGVEFQHHVVSHNLPLKHSVHVFLRKFVILFAKFAIDRDLSLFGDYVVQLFFAHGFEYSRDVISAAQAFIMRRKFF